MPKKFNDSRQQQQFQTLLKADQLNDNVRKVLAVVFSANIVAANAIDNAINAINDEINIIEDLVNVEDIVDVQDYMKKDGGSPISINLQHNSNSTSEQSFSSAKTGFKIQKLLENLLQKAYKNDKVVNSIIAAKEQGLPKLSAKSAKQGIKLALRDLTVAIIGNSKRLYVKNRMYVPNDKDLQLFLLQ